MTISFQHRGCHNGALPSRATPGSAGFDLSWHPHAMVDGQIRIYPGEIELLPTGWAVRVPDGWVGLIRDRSGQAARGLTTRAGVIDSDYRGEVGVIITNETEVPIIIKAGERIAQLVIVPCVMTDAVEVDELGGTERGDNGFGSTGNRVDAYLSTR